MGKFWSIVLLGATLILLILAAFTGWGYVPSLVLVGGAFTTGIGCAWCAAEHREGVDLEIARTVAYIESATEEIRRYEAVGRLTDFQIRYLMSQRVPIVDVTGDTPVVIYRLLTDEVPQDFIAEFVLKWKDLGYLRPERFYAQGDTWMDGKLKREYAKAVIGHCIQKKYAAGPEFGRKKWMPNGRTLFLLECGLGIKELK